jgi:hypothetical protein
VVGKSLEIRNPNRRLSYHVKEIIMSYYNEKFEMPDSKYSVRFILFIPCII